MKTFPNFKYVFLSFLIPSLVLGFVSYLSQILIYFLKIQLFYAGNWLVFQKKKKYENHNLSKLAIEPENCRPPHKVQIWRLKSFVSKNNPTFYWCGLTFWGRQYLCLNWARPIEWYNLFPVRDYQEGKGFNEWICNARNFTNLFWNVYH